MTALASSPTIAEQLLEQIDETQDELVLDDAAIRALPHIVYGVTHDGDALLIDRKASLVEASHRVEEIAVTAGSQYAELGVMGLDEIGFAGTSSSTVADPPASSESVDDDTDDDDPIEDPDGQTALVDRSEYEREDLAIPKIDGNQVDRIALSFAGTVFLDRSDPDHVRIYNALTMGRSGLTLKVTGRCSGTAGKLATDKGGSLDVVVGTKTLKVESVDVPGGAGL